MSEQTSFPLCWPAGWKRTQSPGASRFGPHSVDEATTAVVRELAAMGVNDWQSIISTNMPLRRDGRPRSDVRPEGSPGVAVYFKMRIAGKEKDHVLACDKWNTVACNLWAIAKDIEATRGKARWGVGTLEQAFAGYAALPPPGGLRDWWVVLCVDRSAEYIDILLAFREAAKTAHPDVAGGSHERMAALNTALASAKCEKGVR